MSKNTEVKETMASTREEIREVIWCYMHCRKYLTDNSKVYEIRRKRSPDCRRFMVAKKVINRKNCIMKNKNITEMETEEIKKEMQEDKRKHINKSEGEQP